MATRYPLVISGTQIQELQTGDTLLGSVANITGGSAGQLPYQSGANTTGFTSAGTSGQYLQSTGAGAPTWATPSGGALVFLSSQTVSSAVASVNFNGLTGYDKYRVIIQNVVASTATSMFIRIGTGSSPSYINPISYMYMANNQSGTVSSGGNTGSYDRCDLTQQAWSSSLMADITIAGFTSASRVFGVALSHYKWDGGGQLSQQFSSFNASTGSVCTAIQFIPQSGTINSGSFFLYGITSS